MQTGVVLMTYGSPRDLDDVGAYMTQVRGGRAPDDALVTEFRRRYRAIGMSPLIEITQQQANALSALLGQDYAVTPGMRFSEPSIAAAVSRLVELGAERILGLILSPQYSPLLMGGYDQAIQNASPGVPTRIVGAWHLHPAFIDVLATRIRHALTPYPAGQRDRIPILLTAHSLPRLVVARATD